METKKEDVAMMDKACKSKEDMAMADKACKTKEDVAMMDGKEKALPMQEQKEPMPNKGEMVSDNVESEINESAIEIIGTPEEVQLLSDLMTQGNLTISDVISAIQGISNSGSAKTDVSLADTPTLPEKETEVEVSAEQELSLSDLLSAIKEIADRLTALETNQQKVAKAETAKSDQVSKVDKPAQKPIKIRNIVGVAKGEAIDREKPTIDPVFQFGSVNETATLIKAVMQRG